MKQLLEIARREIWLSFHSPIGWILVLVFMVHAALSYMGMVDIAISVDMRSEGEDSQYTSLLFNSNKGVFRSLAGYFYLYIPFLTMGFMSREYSEGGIRLLFSSPLKTIHIVLGKYFAGLLVALIMVAVLWILGLVTELFVLESMDWSVMIVGSLHIFLTLSLYVAIGLFISSLTSYQLVAAIGSFGVLYLMNFYIRTLVQTDHPEFIQTIFHNWLPTHNHMMGLSGLINLTSIMYYLILVSFFLTLTWIRLEFTRRSLPVTKKILAYVGLSLVTLFLGWYTSQPASVRYFDLSASRTFTPDSNHRSILARISEPVSLTRYVNVLERPDIGSLVNYPGRNSIYASIRARLKQDLDVHIQPYYGKTQNLHHSLFALDSFFADAGKLALQSTSRMQVSSDQFEIEDLVTRADERFSWFQRSDLISADEIVPSWNLNRRENKNAYQVRVGSKTALLQDAMMRGTDVQNFLAVLRNIIERKPVIHFLAANGERDPYDDSKKGYSKVFTQFNQVTAPVNHGFDVTKLSDTFHLRYDSLSFLAIADPAIPYSQEQLQELNEYIRIGGNLLLTISPANAQFLEFVFTTLGVEPIVVADSVGYAKVNTQTVSRMDNSEGFFREELVWSGSTASRITTHKGEGKLVAVPDALKWRKRDTLTDFKVTPVLLSGTDSIVISLTRLTSRGQQRILLAGSAGIFANGTESIGFRKPDAPELANKSLAIAIVKWLSNDQYPIDVAPAHRREKLTVGNISTLKFGLFVLMPLPLIVMGIVVLTRRRKK